MYGKPKKNFKINEKSKLKIFNNYSKGYFRKKNFKFSKRISYLILPPASEKIMIWYCHKNIGAFKNKYSHLMEMENKEEIMFKTIWLN